MVRYGHFIGGGEVTRNSERSAPVGDPSTGEVVGEVALAGAAEIANAVQAAEQAFGPWAMTPALHRARVMIRFLELCQRDRRQLTELISAQHGKVLSDADGEVQRGLEVVEFAIGIPHLLKGDYANGVSRGIDMYDMRKPLGVVAGITPFNFPVMVPMWMFVVAIACGNAFILKPSEKSPGPALMLARLLHEAGLPAGVFNVVNGDREAVDAILDHPDIKAVSFVGSTGVARHVYARGSANGKRVQAMGGAKNHAVIMPDADLDGAADALIGAAFGSAGERCMAISAAVVVGQSSEALVEQLLPRIAAIRTGPALASDSQMGPLITADHLERVRSYISLGVDEGARLRADGRTIQPPQGYQGGHYMGPTLFDRVTSGMRSYQDEIFGPVLQILESPTLTDAVSLIAEHPYGNGSAIFTQDGDAAHRFIDEVEAGMVGVNVPLPVPLSFFSFGGWKQSAFGDTNQYGVEGVRFYTRVKTVTARWPRSQSTGVDLRMPTL